MLLVWLLNAVIAVGVFISLFTFGEPVTKPSTSASVNYWRHRNQADVYLRRVCTSTSRRHSALAIAVLLSVSM